MAEYIERTEALEITTRTCGDYAAAWTEIRKLTAADVAPVVHARWIPSESDFDDDESCLTAKNVAIGSIALAEKIFVTRIRCQ